MVLEVYQKVKKQIGFVADINNRIIVQWGYLRNYRIGTNITRVISCGKSVIGVTLHFSLNFLNGLAYEPHVYDTTSTQFKIGVNGNQDPGNLYYYWFCIGY